MTRDVTSDVSRDVPSDAAGMGQGQSHSGSGGQGGAGQNGGQGGAGLRVRDLVVRFGDVTAVDHVDLDLPPGQIVALLGPSGSGKSSLLRGIAGLEPLAGGSVRWDGTEVSREPVHTRGFGVMFQDGQLFPHRDVGANVGYGIEHLRPADRSARVGDLLELVGLAGYQHRPITTLSGGQAQRVALARSLAPHPRLLMLDEPLSSLDRALRERLVGLLRQALKATGTTAVYVTHDQDEAFVVADRVAVMDSGQILRIDQPGRLWRDPGSEIVARFLGYGPILDATAAHALGWPVDLAEGARVAVGPEGLAEAATGLEVPVTDQVDRRGHTAVVVSLPDGQSGVIRTREHVDATTIGVRLIPAQCATLPPAAADASRARL